MKIKGQTKCQRPVLGGVEVLYERIFDNASKPEEYLMNFYELLEELEVRIYEKDFGLE